MCHVFVACRFKTANLNNGEQATSLESHHHRKHGGKCLCFQISPAQNSLPKYTCGAENSVKCPNRLQTGARHDVIVRLCTEESGRKSVFGRNVPSGHGFLLSAPTERWRAVRNAVSPGNAWPCPPGLLRDMPTCPPQTVHTVNVLSTVRSAPLWLVGAPLSRAPPGGSGAAAGRAPAS